MDVLLMTFVLGLLLGVLIIMPRFRRSSKMKGKTRDYMLARRKAIQKCSSAIVLNPIAKSFKIYSKEEVSLHNTRTDCWLIIKDKVYDVTSYVEEHPGGDAILTHAGNDTTTGFYGPQHGGGVFQLIEDFLIGDLEK